MADERVHIIGGGLAGCEAAWQARKAGIGVSLYEMKPVRFSPAHSIDGLAELVCSNSLKSERAGNAAALLKEEMRLLDSIIIRAAEAVRVPAGGSLAVDRAAFSEWMTRAVHDAGVDVIRGEVERLPASRPLVVATGPLTSDALAASIQELIGRERLEFYDAVAPVVHADSIDMERAFHASRYGRGGADYINCPLDRDEYRAFVRELLKADRARAREFEDLAYFEGCMPIEEMAHRGAAKAEMAAGPDGEPGVSMTLAYGPMKPVGLTDPRTGRRPCAVVQLRVENSDATLYSMVGFQTRLTYADQRRVFRLIPALERAEFARLGKMHRNSYIDSPALLDTTQRLRTDPSIFFAGQITGVEGYCESAVSGLLAGVNAARLVQGAPPVCPPGTTMTGALMEYVSSGPPGGTGKDTRFQPMNANMGLLPPLRGRDRRERQAERALQEMARWRDENLAT